MVAAYHGKRDMPTTDSNNNRITLDEYWQVFGKLIYTLNSEWHGFVQIKNLLDENLRTPPENAGLTEGVPNRGREVLLGIIWQF